jgi:hypothetical protein
MAFDKAVDSAVLDANLKTVADAIREKAGTSDSLVFPTGFAEAIAGIQAGGGGAKIFETDFTPAQDVIGTDESTWIPIEHNLGAIPHTAIIYRKQLTGAVQYETFVSFSSKHARNVDYCYKVVAFNYTSGTMASEDSAISTGASARNEPLESAAWGKKANVINLSETSLYVCGQGGDSKARLKAGADYHLVVMA